MNPTIIDAAYANSDQDPGTGTSLFYIDHALNTLVTTTNPNGGVLQTVGALGLDTNDRTGFDIFSDGIGGNTAYALLTAASGVATLASIDLTTGAATSLGVISQSGGTRPYGLAIAPSSSVPDGGGSLALLGIGAASLALVTRVRAKG